MTAALADARARELITGADPAGLDQTLFVEAGAGSGKTGSLVTRVLALVTSGVELRHVAAITFTEKAAAELRDRIRLALERAERATSDPLLRDRFRTALGQVDMAALSTLHSFAQRLLTEFPLEAGLPPNVDLLDEVSSEIEFEERWRVHRDQLLEDTELAQVVQLAMAAGVRFPDDVRQLALEFERNWDLATDPVRVPRVTAGVPHLDVGSFLAGLDDAGARCDDCSDPDDALAQTLWCHARLLAEEIRSAPDDAARLRLLDPGLRRPVAGKDAPVSFKWNKGRKTNWPDGAKEEIAAAGLRLIELRDEARQSAVDALLARLAGSVADFVTQAAQDRVRQGRLEFHDLLVLARHLLRGPSGPQVRDALRMRYRRLLLDEFQDTDPIQVEIAVLLASGDAGAGEQAWSTTATDPGRLFFVGDPKQSIYRFRRADVGLFLEAQQVFAEGQPVRLSTNFRTSPTVITWLNDVFGRLITHSEGSQPAYEPLDPSPTREDPPSGPAVTVIGQHQHPYGSGATTVREREADEVADIVVRAVAEKWQVADKDDDDRDVWRDARYGDVTILLPARTSLPMLEDALTARGVPYRAESSSLVYATREVRDLLLAVRAVVDPTDQLALVATLRSQVYGCSDADLVAWRRGHEMALHLRAPGLDDAPAHPVRDALVHLRGLHDRLPWLSPAEVLDRLCRDRQLFEQGHATRRPRDVWRRLRFVIDQARAWSEAEGGTVREYLAWARRQSSESVRVAETILPETDDDSVRVMTVHAAKGLEFPISILSGTSSRPGGRRQGVQVVWPPGRPVGIRLNARVTSEEFDAFQPIDEQMDHHERLRLLYVACTRARDHLVVSLHREERKGEVTDGARMTSAELLEDACRGHVLQVHWAPGDDVVSPPAPRRVPAPMPWDDWVSRRRSILAAGGWPRTVGATGVQELLRQELDEGDEKQSQDLDLPAWRKGRYGSAIGRAVHGVLQTVDLATGEGLSHAAAAQAAAEGVVGREDDVEALSRAALGSPVVQQAAAATERWREMFVAVQVGERMLEGYIDLAYRSLEGLVVVDYKTASSAHDLDVRMDHYRGQGGAYALALQQASGEPVARVVFVFLTPDGAVERDLEDPMAAAEAVRAVLEPAPV